MSFILIEGTSEDGILSPDKVSELSELKKNVTIAIITLFVILWLNPLNFMYRPIRYEIFVSLINMVIAPFGNVNFKTYLLAEILTDCMTVM